MPQQIINNGETGLTVRNKLNSNFAELYQGKDAVTVNLFADLPAASGETGERWWVLQSSGVWLVNRKNKGAYYSDGVDWIYLGDFPQSATEVSFSPTGNISATTVQAAIAEVETDTATLLTGKANTGAVGSSGITMATARLLGRSTAGTGALEEITLGTNLAFTGTTLNAAGGGGAPGGITTQVQFNNAGVFGGAPNVLIEGDELRLPSINIPSAPSAGGVKLYSTSLGGRIIPTFLGPSGVSARIQPFFGTNRVSCVRGISSGTSLVGFGFPTVSATGTATATSIATTNLHTSIGRLDYLVTTAATTAVAGARVAATPYFRGNSTAGVGGYTVVLRVGPATGPSTTAGTMRMFAGLWTNTAPTDVNPSTLLNTIGFGCDSGDTQMQIMHNDGTGTATKVALGAGFPKPTVDRSDVYEIAFFTPPNGSDVRWTVINLTNGNTASGTITTDLPANTFLCTPNAWCSVGGTNSVVGLTVFSIYVENDN